MNTFKTHFKDKDHLTLTIINKYLGTLNKAFTDKSKMTITCYNNHESCFNLYQLIKLSKNTRGS